MNECKLYNETCNINASCINSEVTVIYDEPKLWD